MDEQCAEEQRMVTENTLQDKLKITFCSALYVLFVTEYSIRIVSVKLLRIISNLSIWRLKLFEVYEIELTKVKG